MLNRDINSVPYLLLAVSAPHPTVSYVVLTWRLNELGGERHCRQWLKKLQAEGLVELQSDSRADRREKSVHVTEKGYRVLRDLRAALTAIGDAQAGSRGAEKNPAAGSIDLRVTA
jgi:hypothetical protein